MLMKIFVTSIAILWSTTLVATEICQPERYPAMHLGQWMYDCSTTLYRTFESQRFPPPIAGQMAAYYCGCVIDKFRANFSWQEASAMHPADRLLFSEQFTKECLGRANEPNT